MDTKERIILAGEELFSQRGYDATSVSLICERAGVSKGAFSIISLLRKNSF